MRKFGKRFSFLVAALMLLTMLTVALTSSAADNARIFWDFTGTTEDIALWESETLLWAYDPWSTADLEIEDNILVINHMTQDTGCNSLNLMINRDREDLSAYKSIAFWLDASKVQRPFTVRVSIDDFTKNNIGVKSGSSFYLYHDNGTKQEKKAGGDPNWIFFNLPYQFKGYIEVPFEAISVLNWDGNKTKNVDASVLTEEFRLILEFNNAVDGEVTRLDNVQLIKSGNPIGWVEGTPSSSAPPSSSPPASSQEPEPSSEEPVDSDDSAPSETSDDSDGATGSDEVSSQESVDESQTSATSSEGPKKEDGNTGLIVALVIIGVAVVAGGGFAAYKFVTSKK